MKEIELVVRNNEGGTTAFYFRDWSEYVQWCAVHANVVQWVSVRGVRN